MTNQPLHTLKEASSISGVPIRTLRRLCVTGLIPRVKRNRSGYRVLTEEQINLAQALFKMKSSGFKAREIRHFSQLYREGNRTKEERKAILVTRKRQLWQEIEARQAAIDFIERQEEYLS